MSGQNEDSTGSWVAKKIEPNVEDVNVVESQILSVRRQYDTFILGTTASKCVDSTSVRTLTEMSDRLSFIVSIQKDSFWTGGAIDLISQRSIAFGGMGDLYRALSDHLTDVRQYRNPEFVFVEQVLGQHNIVVKMDRIHDRKYVLKRRGLSDFTIVLMNEYELTKDHVRIAIGRYNKFDAILITNPNGNATAQAKKTGRSMNIGIYKLGELMARINGR